MEPLKAVAFVTLIGVKNSDWCNFLGVMFLLKSNVPKLAWHHAASLDWKIASYAETDWSALCPT